MVRLRDKITNAFIPRRIHQYIRIVSGVRPVFTTMDTTYTMKQIFDYFGSRFAKENTASEMLDLVGLHELPGPSPGWARIWFQAPAELLHVCTS